MADVPRGTPTYTRGGDPAGRYTDYYPAWVDNPGRRRHRGGLAAGRRRAGPGGGPGHRGHHPLALLLLSRLVGEKLAGTPLAEYFLAGESSGGRARHCMSSDARVGDPRLGLTLRRGVERRVLREEPTRPDREAGHLARNGISIPAKKPPTLRRGAEPNRHRWMSGGLGPVGPVSPREVGSPDGQSPRHRVACASQVVNSPPTSAIRGSTNSLTSASRSAHRSGGGAGRPGV
jgi:hypothetical protein